MKRATCLAALTAPASLLIFAAASRAATTVFNDNFNRNDANSLGPNWTPATPGVLDTNGSQATWVSDANTMYFLSGLTGAYTHTTLKVDVSMSAGSTGFQSVALCIGQPNSPGSAGLFLQVVAQGVTSDFNRIELDTGLNTTDPTKWTDPTSIFTPANPFASARITASLLDADSVRIGIDTNFDNIDEEFFTRELNLGNMTFGNRMGLSINGGVMRADNFSASVIAPGNVTWNLAGGGTWDKTSNNWTGGSLHPNRYSNADSAFFSSTFGGTITLAGGVGEAGIAPASTTVNAGSGTYTFAGGGILSGTLDKEGFGRLVLANPNTFTGDTIVHNSGSVGANGTGAHLTLNNPSGNSLSGDLHIGDASSSGVAKVSLAQSNQIADNRVIYFDSPSGRFAYFSLRGNSETVAGIHSNANGGAIENGNFNGAINTDGTLTLSPTGSTTYGGIIRDADSGGGTGKLHLVKNLAGTQVLTAGSYTYTGSTTVNFGLLRLETSLTSSAAVTVNSGKLELASGGGSSRVIKTGAVTVGPNARLDLFDNKLIVTGVGAIGSWTGSNYGGVTGLIAAGKGTSNLWSGAGIITSQSTAIGSNLTTIGVTRGSELLLSRGLTASDTYVWAGQTISASDTLVMYTYGGDTNLDGKLNIDDYVAIDQGITANLTGWSNGDFNYDGKIDIDDYSTFIDSNINNQTLGMFPTSGGIETSSAVPEPAFISLPFLAGYILTARRRRAI